MFPVAKEVLKQMFKRPFTNPYPVKYKPKITLTEAVKLVQKGQLKLMPPVPVPEGYRGRIMYNIDDCIGCQLCIRVCPTRAIEFVPEVKKIRIYISRCTFCSQCNDICPKNCLSMSKEFELADYEKYGKALVIGATEDYLKKVRSDSEGTKKDAKK